MARQATHLDIPHLLTLAEEFQSTSIYKNVRFDEDAVRKLLINLVNMGSVFLNDTGFIAGSLAPLSFNPQYLMAVELAWYSPEEDATPLREAFEEWARNQGCTAVQFNCLVNNYSDKVNDIYIEAGYTPIEVAYIKEL